MGGWVMGWEREGRMRKSEVDGLVNEERKGTGFVERYSDICQLKEALKTSSCKRVISEYSPRGFSGRRRTGSYLKYSHRSVCHRRENIKSQSCRRSRRRLPLLTTIRTKLPHSLGLGTTHTWLYTHRWHTKRFKMCSKWGHVLGKHHAARGLKFVWRKLKNGSVMHDMSYVRPVELCGPKDDCIKVLSQFIDPMHVNWLDDHIWTGRKETQVCLYRANSFPLHCMGPVKLSTCPPVTGNDEIRKVWLWVHAACYDEVLEELSDAVRVEFPLSLRPMSSQLCRFALRGAQSSIMLRRVLHPADVTSEAEDGRPHFAPPENCEFVQKILQSEALNTIWKHNYVVGAACADCRELKFTRNGEAARRPYNAYARWSQCSEVVETPAAGRKKERLRWPSAAASCPGIFDETTRSFCAASMTTTAQLHERRRGQRRLAYTLPDYFRILNKGDNWTAEDLPANPPVSTETDNRSVNGAPTSPDIFPALLVRQSSPYEVDACDKECPASNRRKCSTNLPLELSGWDVIVPAVWANAVWIAFSHAGACSVGLDEVEAVQATSGTPSFPRDFPDSSAGQAYWEELGIALSAQEERRPTRKKRVRRVGRVPDWNTLFENAEGYSEENCDVTAVIRNAEYLAPFVPAELLTKAPHESSMVKIDDTAAELHAPEIIPAALPFRTLIRVYLKCTGRGTPHCGAELYQPELSDYRQWLHHSQGRATRTTSKGRRLGEWWGVEHVSGRREDCSRVVGYVSTACHSDLRGNPVIAVGFCEAIAFKLMLYRGTQVASGDLAMLVMYRNPLSKWFRPAIIEVHSF